MSKIRTLLVIVCLLSAAVFGLFSIAFAAEDASAGRDVVFTEKGLPYGFEGALPEIHGFISQQYWNAESDMGGSYADTGSSSFNTGESTFMPHSAYLDFISELNESVLIEVEFELYHGSSAKICAERVLWHPGPEFNLSIGRQFVMLGSQEKVYYPTSKYRFFTWQPYLYEKALRFTGWWDSGLSTNGRISLSDENDMFVEYGLMVSNGPGTSGDSLGANETMSSNGFVYEKFNDAGRQSSDNNDDKPITWRLGFSPLEGLLWRIEGMSGKHDTDDKYDFSYITSEIFYSKDRFDGMIGFLSLTFDSAADPAVAVTGTNAHDAGIWPGGEVEQSAYYIVAGYKILDQEAGINFLQPVIRYQYFNPNMSSPSAVSQYENYGERDSIELGLNFSPWEHVVFRTAYRWQDLKTGPTGTNVDGNGFTMEVVADF